MTDFPCAPTRSTSSRSCGRSASRIREKRGVDYTEDEIRELASVKLEPSSIRKACARICSNSIAGASEAGDRRRNYRVRGHDALRVEPAVPARHPQAAAADPEALLQPQPADRSAAHPVAVERLVQPAPSRSTTSSFTTSSLETTRLEHRGQEPQDARRVDVEPSRFRRAARTRARRRRAVSAGRRRAAAAALGRRSGSAAGEGDASERRAAPATPPRTPPARSQRCPRSRDRIGRPAAPGEAGPNTRRGEAEPVRRVRRER